MRKRFLVLTLIAATPVVADLPSAGYVSEFLGQICHNPNVGLDTSDGIASNRYVLSMIDALNVNNVDYFSGASTATSYAADLTSDSLVSVGYLNDISKINKKIAWSDECCLDGTRDPNTGECMACGTWTRDNDATKCPTGWTHVELNAVLVNTGDACPMDTMPYFEIPDDCENNIF